MSESSKSGNSGQNSQPKDLSKSTNEKGYHFGGIKEYNLEQIETEALTENSYFYLDVFAGSDLRLKSKITPIEGALEKVTQLNGVTYEWNPASFSAGAPDSRRHAGLIAQDVAAVMPELAGQEPTTGYLGVEYSKLNS